MGFIGISQRGFQEAVNSEIGALENPRCLKCLRRFSVPVWRVMAFVSGKGGRQRQGGSG